MGAGSKAEMNKRHFPICSQSQEGQEQPTPHTQPGFHPLSCPNLLWSLPTFSGARARGQAEGTECQCHLPGIPQLLQPALKCQGEHGSLGNEQHMMMLNCSPVPKIQPLAVPIKAGVIVAVRMQHT